MAENGDDTDNSTEASANEVAQNEAAAPEALKTELEKAKKDYLYLLAEFDNYRKNAIKERSDTIKYGAERLIRELLGIADNFERAIDSESSPEKFREGVQLIHQELKSLMQKSGVTEVPAEGVPFDPATHEALSSEPTDRVPEGHVARVFKKAYKLHDKLIRPAQVVVATTPVSQSDN